MMSVLIYKACVSQGIYKVSDVKPLFTLILKFQNQKRKRSIDRWISAKVSVLELVIDI